MRTTSPIPPLEVVITVDEETGMLGAAALDASVLKGRTMLNLDSEDEGVLTVSCAGGNVSVCTLPVTRAPFSGTALTVTVGGLLGGHPARRSTRAAATRTSSWAVCCTLSASARRCGSSPSPAV